MHHETPSLETGFSCYNPILHYPLSSIHLNPKISIIIPTHNRADILSQCLAHLEQQTIANQIEVIVVNDVQNDKDYSQLANSTWQIPVYFETIDPCHQGVARNHGVQKAQASTVLFIGDDIFLAPRACELHLKAHEKARTPSAVLGNIDWDPSVGTTKVMKWLMDSGWQFGFKKIARYADDYIPESMQHLFSYTSNLSVSKDVAQRTPFREDITLYGWEDIEFGMRLKKMVYDCTTNHAQKDYIIIELICQIH